jgi:hypothetical protein
VVDPGIDTFDPECDSCCEQEYYENEREEDVCPQSLRVCGHHCNYSWSHDTCCWCGKTWEEETDGPANG